MGIERVSNSGIPTQPLKPKKVSDGEPMGKTSSEDRLEISDEAVSLFQSSESKRLESVREKIRSGYYLQREVTEKVADAILKDPEFDKAS